MATILVTGGTGFIGSELIPRLAREHEVVSFARRQHEGPAVVREGSFISTGDLSQLDEFDFDAVVHLAAVKAHCSEADGLDVNVIGTQRLVRYLLDRGCRRFVLASTIAVPGCWNAAWLPPALPIPANQPCMARDAYGLSKWLMEQEAHYFARQYPDAGFVILRLSHVRDDAIWQSELLATDAITHPWLDLADVMLSDVLDAFGAALSATTQPGCRIDNVTGPDVRTREPVATVLRACFGADADQLDLSYHRQDGHEFAPVYDLERTRADLSWVPEQSVRP